MSEDFGDNNKLGNGNTLGDDNKPGRTRWFPRHVHPMRSGFYECAVKISSAVPQLRWLLEWDGNGFLVPIPMVVLKWRGLTKKAFKATREES